VACVERVVPAVPKQIQELTSDFRIQPIEVLPPVRMRNVDAVRLQPMSAVIEPLVKYSFGHRVVSPKRDEADRTSLGPVRQSTFGDENIGFAVEQMK
jgi:hypothetical protein